VKSSTAGLFLLITMPSKPPLLWLLTLLTVGGTPLAADTLLQSNPQGKQVIVHRDAIVVKEDSSFLVYKHFELKERRVVKIRLSRGAQNYTVKTSSPEERLQIVAKWKRFSFKGTVTGVDGKVTRLYGMYLDFYPPGGRGSLLESVAARTMFPVLFEGAGADELDFSKIARVEFLGERLAITLSDGKTKQARFLMPTDQPAEARFLGITDQYDPASEDVFNFSIALQQVKEIRFE
jgi:hypothetical protein